MVHILFKWLLLTGFFINGQAINNHPIFVSVTEIEHNAKNKTLEISCKLFTDDFEKTLRRTYSGIVDLLQPKDKNEMNKLVNSYIQKHFQIKVEGKTVILNFLGYQQEEEGIVSLYQVINISTVKKIDVTDNILFEYKDEQMSIVHVIVNGNRKSTRLLNPDEKYSFTF